MPKICPCQAEMSHDSFLFAILIIDLILNLPSLLGFLLPFIAIIINLRQKNYDNCYFNFYAWLRIISQYITVFVLFLYLLIVFLAADQVPKKHQQYFTPFFASLLILIVVPLIVWNFYTSYQFLDSVKEMQKLQENQQLNQDEEIDVRGSIGQSEKSVQNGNKIDLEVKENN